MVEKKHETVQEMVERVQGPTQYRLIRIIEYVGPYAWIQQTMSKSDQAMRDAAANLGTGRAIKELYRGEAKPVTDGVETEVADVE